MRNRKQRQITNKRNKIVVQQTQQAETSLMSAKYPSSHTKISTNCTIQSTKGFNPTPEKRSKSKKNAKSTVKQNISEVQINHITSKSGRKVKKYEIPINIQMKNIENGQESCRQYCVVESNFVPITDFKQHKILEDIFAQTAATSCDQDIFPNSKEKDTIFRLTKEDFPQLKKSKRSSIEDENYSQKVVKFDKAISNIQNEIEHKSTEVEVKVQSCEIGLQYSERKGQNEEKKEEEEKKVIRQIIAQDSSQDTLADLLFKLQFTHLGDDNSFKNMSSHEKQHFSQLLETVISKLKPVPKSQKSKLKPISFDNLDSESPIEEVSSKNQVNYERLQGLLMVRECSQLNFIEDTYNYSQNNQVNTSLYSILNFLGYLFCHIEVHYSEEFVYMIRKMYGLPYREKYRRITRNLSLINSSKFKVIEESVFEDIVNQSSGTEYNYHQIVHFKAIFDAFNEHLEEYRPYYLGNGEQFPWTFKMFITMSEYSIDEDSLQIIFRQAKDKIVEWVTLLCGIHINFEEQLKENNPLELKKLQKQNKMISNWIAEQNFTKDGIEIYSTQVLHEAAEKIYQDLMKEVAQDCLFIFN